MRSSQSPAAIFQRLGLPDSPVLFDVRDNADFAARPRLIPGALRGDPDRVSEWGRTLPRTRAVVAYCKHGGKTSSFVADALSTMGYPAFILEGGIEAWIAAGHPTVKARADFYTPAHQVRAESQALHAEPYDIADVTFSHRGTRCSFDAFLDEFDLHDPVIDQVANIVRAADTGELGQSR